MEKHSSETKMVIVMRKDLNMTKGKYIAQGGHAILGVVKIVENGEDVAKKEMLKKWYDDSYVKICVSVNSLEELHEIYNKAVEQGEAVKLITDNGLTMFNGVKTDTCLSILGYREDLDKITGHLKLL